MGLTQIVSIKDECDGEVFEEYNIMDQLQCIYNGYQAADSLFLLLSHGGNPNLVVDRQPLFSDPDFDLLYDTENRGDHLDAIPLLCNASSFSPGWMPEDI